LTVLQTARAREPLRVLIVEDSPEDADLLALELRRGGYEPACSRVDTPGAMAAALERQPWDLVLSDYSMPAFSLPEALEMLRARGLDVPFVIVSATIGEEAAVAAMKAGAHDYVLKHNLGRLVPAVRRELRESALRQERRDLEEQLRQAQKLESLGLLAGGVAHDFNNLLTGILGNASLIAEIWSPPDDVRMLLDEVVRASERAADLTRQLLAYAGKGRFVLEPVDLSELVREIIGLVHVSIAKKVRVELALAEGLPAIEADANQIRQLAMNLVLNAAEAVGDAPGRVSIATGVRSFDAPRSRRTIPGAGLPPGDYVYLEVEDTGCGMDDDVRKQIFEPFFTTKFTGRGLGLAAALGIVRGHDGDLDVESAPGKGSRFEVLFPAGARQAPQAGTGPRVERWELAGSGVILVVDDEILVRRAAKAALQQYGYTVFEAADGRAGVELFRAMRDRIGLILLDLNMPVMGGEEASVLIKSIRPDVPVIISSGFDEQEAARRFAGQSAGDFIQKPYTAAGLAGKVKAVLDRRRVRG